MNSIPASNASTTPRYAANDNAQPAPAVDPDMDPSWSTEYKARKVAGGTTCLYRGVTPSHPPRADGIAMGIALPGREEAVLVKPELMWDSPMQFTYAFIPDPDELIKPQDDQRAKVKEYVQEWALYANVSFVEVSDPAKALVRIAFGKKGSWSYVGRKIEQIKDVTKPTMNLGWIKPFKVGPAEAELERAVILHEWGHTLGLLHEHESPAHDSHAINKKAAYDYYGAPPNNWTHEMVDQQVLAFYDLSAVSNFSRVDIHSIMHYPQTKAITGLPYDIPYQTELSDWDRAYMILNYPRASYPDDNGGWDIERALKAAELPSDVCNAIRNAVQAEKQPNGEIRPEKIRNILSDYTQRAFAGYLDQQRGVLPARESEGEGKGESETMKVVSIAEADVQTACGTHMRMNDQQAAPAPDGVESLPVFMRKVLRPLSQSGSPLQVTWRAFGDNGIGPPSPRQYRCIGKSVARWEAPANLKLTEAPSTMKAEDVDISIAFGTNSKPRDVSWCYASGWTTDKAQRMTMRQSAREELSGLFPKWNPTAYADILIHHCPANDSHLSAEERKTLERDNVRSITHELGHAFGLDHEQTGIYHALIHEPEAHKEGLISTKYDFGSLMDARNQQLAADVTKEMIDLVGLGSVPVSTLPPERRRLAIAYDLSPYDKANFALLYPGPELLKPAQVGNRTLLEAYLSSLSLDVNSSAGRRVFQYARAGDWEMVRQQYMTMLQDQEMELVPKLKALVTNLKNLGPQRSLVGEPERIGEQPVAQPTARAKDPGDLADILYTKLSGVFKTSGDQYLALQLPARYLDKNTFSYKTDGIYSQFLKPTVVNEAEFRLTDQLYDVGKFVGGPNGKSLSTTYEAVINNLVPRSTNKDIAKEREKYRAFLLREAPDQAQYFVNDTLVKQSGASAAASKSGSSDATGVRIIGESDDPIAAAAAAFGPDVLDQLQGAKTPARGRLTDSGAPSGASAAARSLEQSLVASKAAQPRKMTLIETSNYLYSEYANDKTRWELGRDDMVRKAIRDSKNDPEALNDVTRRLAHISQAVNSRLSMKYLDAVVRGYYHVVREMVGLMDVKSPAELLQDAKDSFRESALSSVFTASRVWPVLMGPQDWADSLDTSFTPRDLSESPEILQGRLHSKTQQLETLQNQLALLNGAQEGDVATLKDKLAKAEKDKLDAISALHAEYGAATVGAVQLAFKLYLAAQTGGVSLVAEEGLKKATGEFATAAKARQVRDVSEQTQGVLGVLNEKQLQDIAASSQRVDNKQTAVIEAIRSQVAIGAELASAKASDTVTQQEVLRNRATALVKEIEDLQSRFDIAIHAARARTAAKDTPLANDPTLTPPLPAGRWQAVSIYTSVKQSASHLSKKADSSSSSWKLSLWIASAQSESSSASASQAALSDESEVNVAIDFQATLVTVDRSGWFDPGFLANSSSFMKNDSSFSWTRPRQKVAEQPPNANAPPAKTLSSDEMTEAIRTDLGSVFPSQPRFGAFPAGYIVVKDVIVKVESGTSAAASSSSNFQEKKASSGGFLCFSHSSGEEHSGSQQDSVSEARSDGYVVRIPGPQILGYIQQLTPEDNSVLWDAEQSILSNLNIPDKLPHLVFDDGTKASSPARGVVAPRDTPSHAPEQPAIASASADDTSSKSRSAEPQAAPLGPAAEVVRPAYGVWREE